MSPRALIPGVRIEVISNNQSLNLYADPDAEEREITDVPALYVEAVTGATFEVCVTLDETFVRGPCDAVRVGVRYDAQERQQTQYLLQSSMRRDRVAIFSEVRSYNADLGRWQRGRTAFGQLNTTEAVCGPAPKELERLGTISVEVKRVRYIGGYKAPNQPRKAPQLRIDTVPEKALKGRAITHSVELVGSSEDRLPTYSRETKPISGRLGQPMFINIMYRSRRTLQMIGCIPRTPSPERRSSVEDTEGTRLEIERLKVARLASIERRTNVKVKAEDLKTSVKRERGAENVESRKRPRNNGPTKVIDLTVD